MKIRIYDYNGRKMTLVKEEKIFTAEDVKNALDWMRESGIRGAFHFISENEDDENLLSVIKDRQLTEELSKFTTY